MAARAITPVLRVVSAGLPEQPELAVPLAM